VAALAYSIPIIFVSIANGVPHLHRARYRAPHDLGLECMVTLCLSGPAAEELFFGSVTDGGDEGDYAMAVILTRCAPPLNSHAIVTLLRVWSSRNGRSSASPSWPMRCCAVAR
jgi:hypothetical protein